MAAYRLEEPNNEDFTLSDPNLNPTATQRDDVPAPMEGEINRDELPNAKLVEGIPTPVQPLGKQS